MNKIVISNSTKTKTIVIATYNINKSKQSEVNIETKWETRKPSIISLMRSHSQLVDIFLIQEWRSFSDDKTIRNEELASFMANFPEFSYMVSYPNGSNQPFGLITMYKNSSLFCKGLNTFWFSETPEIPSCWDEGYGHNFSAANFYCIENGLIVENSHFVVYNVHLPINVKYRDMALHMLPSFFQKRHPLVPFIMGGDFNLVLLRDLGDNGEKRKEFLAKEFQWLTEKCIGEDGFPTCATYSPYPYEENIDKIKQMDNSLDHFIGKGIKLVDLPIIDRTKIENSSLSPSDHYMLLIKISI